MNQRPLFLGDSEIDEVFKSFRVLDTPNEDTWPGMISLPDFPKWPLKDLTTVIPNLESTRIDIFSKMLYLDSNRRSMRAWVYFTRGCQLVYSNKLHISLHDLVCLEF